MTLDQYTSNINKRYKLGNSTEHTFRGDLQQLLESMLPSISATNEPKRQSCGAPDYILMKNDIPVGFIEAKDIGDSDLDGIKKAGNKEQFDRYKASLNNLMFTDYLSFHLYRDGAFVTKISIGEIKGNSILPLSRNFNEFTNLVKDFGMHVSQSIKNPKRLAEMMAGKARLLSDVIEKALNSDDDNHENSTLREQMAAFKDILIHDITPKGFADVYAQTIAYGMFAARLHDPTLPTFSRQEAAELIPKTNPFLRKLFGYIAGPDIDDRIKWIVDSLVDIFLACNVREILKNYGKSTKMEDPIIHFYETFLSEYDPKLRKARGVWYTPQPMVDFIVRAVDDILKSEFGLKEGLADTSKTKIKVNLQATDKRYKDNIKTVEEEVHRVQILDPATGTGTFLAEVVKHIHKKFEGQEGIWSNYVETHLLPRLNGFELLMASYAMAHLKLDLLLTETGFKPKKEQRFRVYLTNSLEESHPETGTLFANWLSSEANEANRIKRETPVMCVIGNPPYSGESSNKGDWILSLMEDYKKEPGGVKKLNERNPKWINDDYVKFIRYGQHFIEKNGSGILAFINPHGFLDNPTFRGMRWNLLKTYDKIYTIDLHGNSKKKETSPDGSVDQNVFDIMQGVSINIFVKTGSKKANDLAKVFHFDLFGRREKKYEFLNGKEFRSVPYKEISIQAPIYLMVQRDFSLQTLYSKGFSVSELFKLCLLGPNSHRDDFAIGFKIDEVRLRIEDFKNNEIDDATIRKKYDLKDNRDWNLLNARKEIPRDAEPVECLYRPFDNRFMLYGSYAFDYHRPQLNDNLLKDNFGLIFTRQTKEQFGIFITDKPLGQHKIATPYDGSYSSPLYLSLPTMGFGAERIPNLNSEIVGEIAKNISLLFCNEKSTNRNSFAPIDLLDYIYSALHSIQYREKYKEFLKIDFPRIPYPKDQKKFWQLVELGGELRRLHLLESLTVQKYITKYPVDGDNMVTKIKFENGKVYINDTQYFSNVPEIAWNFYIGGYQPAQKWLKDRKDRELSYDDILHYQKIIVALTETDRIMKEIDLVGVE